MTIHFNNYTKPDKRRGESQYFHWMVFVDDSDDILDQIESVEYLLHPTFPKPYQISTNRIAKFALKSAGWGEFDISITVNFRDGHKETFPKYHLDLGKPWPEDDIG